MGAETPSQDGGLYAETLSQRLPQRYAPAIQSPYISPCAPL
jgi:hypothetical protein